MTFKNLRYGLSSSVVLAASLFSVPSYAVDLPLYFQTPVIT